MSSIVDTTFAVVGPTNALEGLRGRLQAFLDNPAPEYRGSNWGSGLNVDFFQESLEDGIYPDYEPGSMTAVDEALTPTFDGRQQFRFYTCTNGDCSDLIKEFVNEWTEGLCTVYWQMLNMDEGSFYTNDVGKNVFAEQFFLTGCIEDNANSVEANRITDLLNSTFTGDEAYELLCRIARLKDIPEEDMADMADRGDIDFMDYHDDDTSYLEINEVEYCPDEVLSEAIQ